MFDYTPYVQNGISFLDKYAPADWRNNIVWFSLDIYNLECCIAGQAFGTNEGYSEFSRAMDLIEDQNQRDGTHLADQDFGFNTHEDDDYDDDDWFSPAENLEDTWRRELGATA
jgi:hypothetical protein